MDKFKISLQHTRLSRTTDLITTTVI